MLLLKHVLLATGLHSMCGQKSPIQILSRLGHAIKYDEVRAIESGWAECSKAMIEKGYELPLVPASPEDTVSTIFWFDNYDESKENRSGGIHNTHGVAWQETGSGVVDRPRLEDVCIQKSRRYQLAEINLPECGRIDPHTNPPKFVNALEPEYSSEVSNREIFYWSILRQHYGIDPSKQTQPKFVGYVITKFANPMSRPKTRMTFLPPITRPITDYSTVLECLVQSQRMAAHSNLRYVHLVADVGAAAKFYHVIWNKPDMFQNVIIHLGDMHGMMENFDIAGKFVEESGFEEIVFQAGLANSGTIRGILTGKHYNYAWAVHECVSEALHRLFVVSYLSDELANLRGSEGETELTSAHLIELHEKYIQIKAEGIKGTLGMSVQYWLTYIDMIERQLSFHFAINVNDWDTRMKAWNEYLPFYFTMNKQNYARYGSFYCMAMKNLEMTHPGAQTEMSTVSICRNTNGIGQSIDGGGEQTFMRRSKTSGGIRQFSHRLASYYKWVLNRPYAAAVVGGLLEMVELDNDDGNPRKCLRCSEIQKSELKVQAVMSTICDDFLNPFDRTIDPEKLFNLVSGKPLSNDSANCLLTADSRGEKLAKQFQERLLERSQGDRFFDVISRQPWLSFKNALKKSKVQAKSGKIKDVSVQRDILGILAAKSSEMEQPIDFKEALKYPLAPVPLALASADGTMCKTAKSKLIQIINLPTCTEIPKDSAYFVDLIAQIRAMVGVPTTFRELARKILHSIPKQYRFVFFACDRYDVKNIKTAEHSLRGEVGRQYSKLKPDMKIPDLTSFMKNGSNKDALLEIIENVIRQERESLNDRVVFVARKSECVRISKTACDSIPDLVTDHMEADTMLSYLIAHSFEVNGQCSVVRSASGDTDIPVVLLANMKLDMEIVLDNGTGKSRKLFALHECSLSDLERRALVGFHAFTGNDYVSSFFRKGKKVLWGKIKMDEEALGIFASLGTKPVLSEEIFSALSKLVCTFYGQPRCVNVDDARYNIFWANYKKGKIVDLSLLPPCTTSVKLHSSRANYVARMWRYASSPKLELESPTLHGWNSDLSLKWVEKAYPNNIADLLVQSEDNVEIREDFNIDDFDNDVDDDIESEARMDVYFQ